MLKAGKSEVKQIDLASGNILTIIIIKLYSTGLKEKYEISALIIDNVK